MEDFDSTIGTLMDAIRKLGIEDNTYVIFTADNGRAWDTNTNDLRGDKWWLFEAGLRVPLIVKGPNIPEGARSNINVSQYDFFPTFVDWAGGNVSRLKNIDGASLKSHMENPGSEPAFANRNLYFHYPHYRNSTPHSAVINYRFKLMLFHEQFDLRNGSNADPFSGQREKINIFDRRPSDAYTMEQDLYEYAKNFWPDLDHILPTANTEAKSNLVPINVDKEVP